VVFLKSKEKNKSVKVIGKNCKYNEDINHIVNLLDYHSIENKKIHRCSIKLKRCGLNHTCDCFNGKGKLYFERKDNE